MPYVVTELCIYIVFLRIWGAQKAPNNLRKLCTWYLMVFPVINHGFIYYSTWSGTHFWTQTVHTRDTKYAKYQMLPRGQILPQIILSLECPTEGKFRLQIFLSIKLSIERIFLCHKKYWGWKGANLLNHLQ